RARPVVVLAQHAVEVPGIGARRDDIHVFAGAGPRRGVERVQPHAQVVEEDVRREQPLVLEPALAGSAVDDYLRPMLLEKGERTGWVAEIPTVGGPRHHRSGAALVES